MVRKKAKSSYYEKLLFVFRNAAAFLPLVMIPFGILARSDLVDSRYYAGDGVFILIIGVYIVASVLNLFYVKRQIQSSAVDVAFSILYHTLTALFIFFISGFLSAFLSVWIVLMISTEMRFSTKGFMASFGGLCVTAALMLLLHPDMPQGEQFEVVQGAIVVGAIGFVIAKIRNVTDRERNSLAKTRQEEIYQRERLLALVNSMGDAVVATDEQGIIKVYNSTLLNLLDTNLNLTGKQIGDVLHLHDSANHKTNILEEAAKRRAVFSRTDLSHRFSDGETIKLYINVAPIQPGYRSHAERGYIFILRDITKEKTLEEERDEFISVVSHELRTPVTIAEGGLSNLLLLQDRGADPAVLKKAIGAAHDQILYLAKLINDLSALSRAERGLGAQTEVVDLNALLHDIYNKYVNQAHKQNLTLDLNVPTRLPLITSSRLYIEEILQNLVTNSLKYTKQGSITIRGNHNKDGVILDIIDTGIGISKTDQKHIFEKFYRSEDYRTRESSGTGLGLYVCQKLAEKMGLGLTFQSRLNHGSTFTLTIPSEQVTASGAKPAATPAAPSVASGLESKHSGLSN